MKGPAVIRSVLIFTPFMFTTYVPVAVPLLTRPVRLDTACAPLRMRAGSAPRAPRHPKGTRRSTPPDPLQLMFAAGQCTSTWLWYVETMITGSNVLTYQSHARLTLFNAITS